MVPAFDGGDDSVWIGGPDEGLGIWLVSSTKRFSRRARRGYAAGRRHLGPDSILSGTTLHGGALSCAFEPHDWGCGAVVQLLPPGVGRNRLEKAGSVPLQGRGGWPGTREGGGATPPLIAALFRSPRRSHSDRRPAPGHGKQSPERMPPSRHAWRPGEPRRAIETARNTVRSTGWSIGHPSSARNRPQAPSGAVALIDMR